jgi:glucokinase
MILAGDIGGTNARLALFTPDCKGVIRQGTIPSQGTRSFEAIVKAFLGDTPPQISAATFGIAGPVVGGRVVTTNLPWELDERVVARRLGIPRVTFINDLVALGLGALAAPRKKLELLQGDGPPAKKRGTLAVIAAGTGLGECALVHNGGDRVVPLGSEGGHADFAPQSALEFELFEFLAKKYDGHVSYERIVSGPGFGNVYDFFRQAKGMAEGKDVAARIAVATDRNAEIARLGADGTSKVAARTLELFLGAYGAEAGNLALQTLATGGVFVAGGIAEALFPRFAGPFLAAFCRKGRMKGLLERMPVALVKDSRIGLAGAAHHAAGLA